MKLERTIDKIVFRLQHNHMTCKDAMLYLSENYGKFGLEMFKQKVRNAKIKSENKIGFAYL